MIQDHDEPFSVPGYQVGQLQADHPQDLRVLQALLERCSDYFELVSGSLPDSSAAASLLNDRPPGRDPLDKFVFGTFTETQQLVGVLDVCRDYPGPEDLWIGLLLLDPAARGQGLGGRIYRAFEAWAAGKNIRRIWLGVIEENPAACRFWKAVGFRERERRPAARIGNREQVVITMLRTLRGRSTRTY